MSERRLKIDSRLDEELARLKPRTASTGFTRSVVAALDETGGRRRPAATGWAFATAAALVVALGIFLGSRTEPPASDLAAERETLRREYGELVRELESLRSLAEETRPLLYLGSGDDLDLVLDLSPMVERQGAVARPASLRSETETPRFY